MSVWPSMLKHPDGKKYIVAVAPNMTDDGRTWYGVKWSDIAKRAARWWDKTGRKEMTRTKGDLTHQDTGVDSALLRGEPWVELEEWQRARVVTVHEQTHVRTIPEHTELLREFMVLNFPDLLDQEELGHYLADGPAADQTVNSLLEGRLHERQGKAN